MYHPNKFWSMQYFILVCNAIIFQGTQNLEEIRNKFHKY